MGPWNWVPPEVTAAWEAQRLQAEQEAAADPFQVPLDPLLAGAPQSNLQQRLEGDPQNQQPPQWAGTPMDRALADIFEATDRGEPLTISGVQPDRLVTTEGKVPFHDAVAPAGPAQFPPGYGIANYEGDPANNPIGEGGGALTPYSNTASNTSQQSGKTTSTVHGDQTSPYEKALEDTRAGETDTANLALLLGDRDAQLAEADAAFQQEVAIANTQRADDESSKAYIAQAEERLRRAEVMTEEINATKIDPTRAFSKSTGLGIANVIAGALAGWVDMKRGTSLGSDFSKVIQAKLDQDFQVQTEQLRLKAESRNMEINAAQKDLNAAQMNEQRLDAAKTAKIQQAIAVGEAAKALVMKNTAPAIQAAQALAVIEGNLWKHAKEIDKVVQEHAWQEEQKTVAHQRDLELERMKISAANQRAANKPVKGEKEMRPVFFGKTSTGERALYHRDLGFSEKTSLERSIASKAALFVPKPKGGSDFDVIHRGLERGGTGQAWARFMDTDDGRYVHAAVKRVVQARSSLRLGSLTQGEMEAEMKAFEGGTGHFFTSGNAIERVKADILGLLKDDMISATGDQGAEFDLEGYLAEHTRPKKKAKQVEGSPAPENGPPPAGMSSIDGPAGMSSVDAPAPMTTNDAPADTWDWK